MPETSTKTATRHRPAPVRFTDEHGRKCLRVPLDRHGRQHAVVTAMDFQKVRDAGAAGAWLLNSNGCGTSYVRVPIGRTLVMPARIIAGAGARNAVRYVNGDPLDLRPENVVLHRGWVKRNDAAIVADHVVPQDEEDGGW